VTVPVEAPPVAKKGLPGWVWGVAGAVGALVLLIAAGGVFLATRGEKPSPTPEATVALVATPTSLPLATATPAPLAPVSPGGPPMDAREVRPCAWEGHGPGLCIYPVGGGAPTKILEDAEFEIIGSSSWSPDGQQIVFSAVKPGESPDGSTIYIVNADGSGLTELPSVGNDISPAWSPNGEWLAFHTSCNLAIMRSDGSDPAVIWDSEGRACTFDPQWSPDSQWIAVSMHMGEGGDWTFPMTREVWVMSRDGATVTTVATITHEDDSCVQPEVAFSPDGMQVAYFDADCRPWMVNADGTGQAATLDDFPYRWTSAAYPQWGGEKEVPPSKPISPSQPEGKVVERCEGVTPKPTRSPR
jgi:dipeptidyl aminopeptidase/acylaminoacyl peptidase